MSYSSMDVIHADMRSLGLGAIYSFCVIETHSTTARERAVALIAKLLHAGFEVTDTTHSSLLIPAPVLPQSHHPLPPTLQKSSIFTLVRQPNRGSMKMDQSVIDQQIGEAKKDLAGQIEIQIA